MALQPLQYEELIMLRTTEHIIHNWKWFVFIVFMAVLTAGLPMRSLAADTGQDAGTEAEADTEQGTGTAAEAEAQQGAGTEAATDTEEPLLMIRVEGRFEEPDRDALIDRLNEIRREACEEGVSNPETGDPLTEDDYVPMEWSAELEKTAAIRAVEASVLRDHMRPDGTECFSLLPDSNVYSMETLAWGYGSTMGAVEGWYSEKEAYVGETGAPAGHYIALIAPANRYAAIADLHADTGSDSCAGAYGNVMSEQQAAEQSATEQQLAEQTAAEQHTADGTDGYWEIPLTRELLTALMNRNLSTFILRFRNLSERYFSKMVRTGIR